MANAGLTAPTVGYEFSAVVEGMRFALNVEKQCDTDTEAGLIAISLSTRILGIEVRRGGAVIYIAPPRSLLQHGQGGHA